MSGRDAGGNVPQRLEAAGAGWKKRALACGLHGAATLLALGLAAAAHAGGPLLVATDGNPVVWDTSNPVAYVTDLGGLGTRSHAAALQMVESGFAAWAAVPTAAIRFENRGDLDVDVDSTNFGPYLGPLGGNLTPLGRNVVVFDADGSIFDLLFGTGTTVAGFAAATFTSNGTSSLPVDDAIPPGSHITEGVVFLNGKFLDGITNFTAGNFEIADDSFEAVFIHEIGHFCGLGHTQIHGLAYGPDVDLPGTTSPVETMFPFLSGADQATPECDDRAWLSALYPAPSFTATTFSIVGRVLGWNGTAAHGVNVIARNVADDADAVSVVSGFDLLGTGRVTLPGLTPGASYTVETQEIDFPFVGGSAVGPFSPPAPVEGPPERYNGLKESSDPRLDDPKDFVTLTGAAGQVVTGINVRLNLQRFSVANTLFDAPGEWSALTGLAFGDFDRDGAVDFVSSQFGFAPGNLLQFHRGLGNGSFATPIMVGRFPGDFTVVAGQFNAGVDDFLDFATASISLNRVRVYFGDGKGGFSAPHVALDLGDLGPHAILNLAAGHLDRDPFTDLAVTVQDPGTGSFTVYSLRGSATGMFKPVATELGDTDAVPATSNIEVADADGDGVGDILALDLREEPALALLLARGSGGFDPKRIDLTPFTRRLASSALTTGDFNGDGVLDVVVTDAFPAGGSPTVTRSFGDILLGDGAGGFFIASRFEIPERFPSALVSADFDNDGRLDVAVTGAWFSAGRPGNRVTVAFGEGAGGISRTETVWGLAPWPQQLYAVDLDNDERLDLVAGTSVSNALGMLATVQSNFTVLRQRACGFSPAAAQGSITLNGVDCAVPNRLSPDGCTASELIDQCRANRRGRTGVMPCTASVLRQLRSLGVVTYREAGRLTSCAARALR